MMATLGPWLRRIFAPVHPPVNPPSTATPVDEQPPDPITARLDAAVAEHKRVFTEAREARDARIMRLASTIDDCLNKNTFRTRTDG